MSGVSIFLGLFVAVGVAIAGFGLRSLHLSHQAADWPTTIGQVTSSRLDVDRDSEGSDTYRTVVTYRYSVNGVDYEGNKIAFGYSASSGRPFHVSILETLSVNTQLAVRYDPDNPTRAVLSYGPNKSIIMLIAFGVIWVVFTGGIAFMVRLMEGSANMLLQNMTVYSVG